MVRLTGPMFSLTASGKFGKAIVYSVWKTIAYARMLVTPANPQSAGQVSMRAMMTFLSQIWSGLTAGNKATWTGLAETLGISAFNAFCKINMEAWDLYDAPGKEYPIGDTGNGGTAPTTTATAGVKQVELSIADGGTPPDWGWIIHRSETTGFTPGRATAVKVIERTGTPTVWVDAPLETGTTYYYRIQGFSADGVMGTLEAEKSATPT